MIPPANDSRRTIPLLGCLLFGIAFAAAYGQAPLYYSNQNQYFLHGLAMAGEGYLADDWLAQTLDPTPVFSALVTGTVLDAPVWVFHLFHAMMLAVYALALLSLFRLLVGPEIAARWWPLFAGLLVLLHSAAIRWTSYRLFHEDYPWFLQAGVAGQYVLGGMFQPSVFGVLLIAAIALFAWDRPPLAVLCLVACVWGHATYVLAAAMVTAGFLGSLAWERRWGMALLVGLLALIGVLPVVAYALWRFGPTSPELFRESQDILANIRIPHHTRADRWIDVIAALQIAWLFLAVALTWRTRLFVLLLVPTLLATLLTLVQVATGSDGLALLFPWRISAVLVPIATAVILSRIIGLCPFHGFARRAALEWASILMIAALAGVGLWISFGRLAFQTSAEEEPLYAFVRQTRAKGDLYFLPVRLPNLVVSTRGSLSSDFRPQKAKQADARIVPVDLQRFRLHAGVPIYVDFKSIPYKDAEVLEWHRRMVVAQAIQDQFKEGKMNQAVDTLASLGVTHLVMPANQPLADLRLHAVYEDPNYRVYLLEVHDPSR